MVEQINKIYSNSTLHSHEDFLNLDIVKNDSKFKELIKQLVENDDDILKNISGYYHPIGFIKIVLYKGKKGEQLRFHFWGKGGIKAIQQDFNNGREPIHNHRWNFSSKVVMGRLDMKEYQDASPQIRFDSKKEAEIMKTKLNETYKLYDIFIIPSRQKDEDYKTIPTNQLAVIGDCTSKYVSAGNSYYLDHHIPHQVKSESNTSTILLIDPPSKLIASEIFPDQDDHFQEEFKLQDLSLEEAQRYLREFLYNLQ